MKNVFFGSLIALAMSSCVQILGHDTVTPANVELSIPDQFNYQTTTPFTLSITTLDNNNKPLTGVPLQVGFLLDSQFVMIMTSTTDRSGNVVIENSIPSYLDYLVVRTDYLGLSNETISYLQPGANTLTVGGDMDSSGRVGYSKNTNGRTLANGYTYLSSFDGNGVPNNLEPVNDYIPQDLLDIVNASLPEMKPVPTNSPQYLSDNIDTDTKLSSDAEVWVTFVAEGAGYRNALGYYSYATNNPPTTVTDIKSLNIVFPNVSLPGSGGNLRSGSKVSLGKFPANTSIGWFLVPDGWNGTTVQQKSGTKFSTKSLNTFTTLPYRQHTVLLNDAKREFLLLGMEDVSRPGGDNDFNDAVFYVTANPYSAINTPKLAEVKTSKGNDSDNDGVLDQNDKYPNDATKAFDIFTPGAGVYGSLAFEDQWPAKGDYDMNDMVVDYNFQLIANTSNAVVEIHANLLVKAVGAAYQNGFGIELPISPSKVKSVSGVLPGGNLVSVSPNGTEANQKNAVVIVFENTKTFYNNSGFVNTKTSDIYTNPVSFNIVIVLNAPVKLVDLGSAPFNPFIFVDGDRKREIHLPDFTPTSVANPLLFGSSADSSRPLEGRYYKAGNNLPWAINIALPFDYPQESRPINESYLKFATWAQSGGTNYKDWYKSTAGYRQDNMIYKH